MSSPTARLPPGTVGRPIKVTSNLVRMTLTAPNKSIHCYSVAFQPDIPNSLVRAQLINEMRRKLPKAAPFCFDGRASGFSFTPITDNDASLVLDVCDPKFVDIATRESEASIITEKRPALVSNYDKSVQSAAAATALKEKASKPEPSGAPAAAAPSASAGAPDANGAPSFVDPAPSGSRPKRFHVRVTIKPHTKIPLSSVLDYANSMQSPNAASNAANYPGLALQALQVIIRSAVMSTYRSPVMIGASAFDLAAVATSPSLGYGAVLLRGLFQAPRVTSNGLLINIDTSSVDILKVQPLVHYIVEACGLRSASEIATCRPNMLAEKVKGLRVETTHTIRRRYTISHLGAPADKHMITTPAGESLSVFQYFRRTYPGSVSQPSLPVAHLLRKVNVVIPIEVLRVLEGQRIIPDINTQQRMALIDLTCMAPGVRLDLARSEAVNLASCRPLAEQGISVATQLTEVPARVLPSIPVFMGGKAPTRTFGPGVWSAADQAFANPAPRAIQSPLIIIASPRVRGADDPAVSRLINELIRVGGNCGVRINKPTKAIICSSPRDVEFQLSTLKMPPDFVFGFCAASDPGYVAIKRECELRWGIPSQCFDTGKVTNPKKANDGYVINVLLKINAKLGGVNHCPSKNIPVLLRDKVTLVMGADVSHETGRSVLSHSAVVGSLDPNATRYGGIVQQQGARVEGIPTDNIARVTGHHLRAFRAATKRIPERIIYIRDGVADSQVAHLITTEIGGIAQACVSLGIKPEIVCMTAVKRHHTRFHGATAIDKSGNLQSGVVIDTGVVRPDLNEFYLFGHAGLKGTSRPCLYQVIYNESKHGMDAMQELAFYLSHLHQRATRAVSLPVPVYYAHLLAYRARYYSPRFAQAQGSRPVPTPEAVAAAGPGGIEAATAVAEAEWPMDRRVKPTLYGTPYYL